MICTVFLFLMISLGVGVQSEIYPLVEEAFPEKEIIIEPKSSNLAFLKVSLNKIDQEKINQIEGMDGVEKVLPVLPLKVPAIAIVSIVGNEFGTDVTLYGVDEELIEKDLVQNKSFVYAEGRPVPVIVSEYFLELYNNGLAEANGLPKLSRQSVIGRKFDLEMGESSFNYGDESESFRCEVVGLTRRSGIIGAMVPIDFIRKVNLKYKPGKGNDYSQAYVMLESLTDYDGVESVLTEMGFHVRGNVLRNVQSMIFVGVAVMVIVSGSLIALALVSLFNAFNLILNEQMKFIAISRAVGLSRLGLRVLILSEVILIAMVGGLVGCLIGNLICSLINMNIAGLVGEFEILPDRIFIPSFSVWFDCLLIVGIGSILTPLRMILKATRLQPAMLLGARLS